MIGTDENKEQDQGSGSQFESPAVTTATDEEIKKAKEKGGPKSKGTVSIIRPVTNSRLMTKVANIVDNIIEADDGNGGKISQTLGTWQGERFADSRQNFRPEFDTTLGQFDIRRPDGTLWDQDDANRCLKAIPLTYEEGESKAGEPIMYCNIHAPDDPYFRHRGLVKFATEGELSLNKAIEKEGLLLQMYTGNEEVAIDNGEEILAGDIRYLISDPEAQEEKAEKGMNEALDANKLFLLLEDDRARIVDMLRMFNQDPDDDTSLRVLRMELYKYAADDATTEEGATYRRRFIAYGRLDKPDLHMRGVIALAMSRGVIRTKGGVYWLGENNLGKLYSEVVDYFRRYEDEFLEMKKRLGK